MAKAKSKEIKKALTLASIKNENKKYKEKITVDIKGYELKIDKYFSPSKINDMVRELGEKLEEMGKQNIQIKDIDIIAYMYLLVIKHFTSLQIPNDLSKQLQVLNELIDGDFLNDIINAIPEEEWKKIGDVFARINENINITADLIEEMVAKGEIKNPEALGLTAD